jgi:hypothetical protein
MQIIINRIEVEVIETTPAQSNVKTYEQGERATIYFTAYKDGIQLDGKVESINPAFDAALEGLRNAISSEIKKTFI